MKKFFLLCYLVLICSVFFPQTIVSQKLTDQDIENFINNYEKITNELHEYISNSINEFSGIIFESEISEEILQKYGISGPNRSEKMKILTSCIEIIYEMNEEGRVIKYSDINQEILERNEICIDENDFIKVLHSYAELKSLFEVL